MNIMKRVLVLSMAALLFSVPLSASVQWEKKPYTEWSEKEALKLLNDSPWGRTQVFSSPVTLFRGPTGSTQQPTATTTANATHVNFRIRFLSAKPVRQAVTRLLEINQKQAMSDELAAHLKSFTSG